MSPLRSAIGNSTRSLLCGAMSAIAGCSRMEMVCRSAPHQGKRGRNGGRSSDSMDGGTTQTHSRVGAEMKTPDHAQSSAALGVLCAVAAATVFSTGGVIVRRIDLPAWDVSFWRSVLLVATILPLLVWQRRAVLIDVRNAGPALFGSAVALAGSMVAFILALGEAPVANVLIVFGATPFITALLARVFLGEPLHRHTLVAMAVAIAGLALSVMGSLEA